MRRPAGDIPWIVAAVGMWLLTIAIPLIYAILQSGPNTEFSSAGRIAGVWGRTIGLAGLIAAAAVALGIPAGKVMAESGNRGWVLALFILPLALPQHALYYAWSLLLSPTTALGRALATNANLARWTAMTTGTLVQIGWYWPLAGLFLSQGWRRIDPELIDLARTEADWRTIRRRVVWPILARPAAMTFGVCFVLTMSDFATFHLSGVKTVGTELALIYEMTGSAAIPAGYSLPAIALALGTALGLGRIGRLDSVPAPRRQTRGAGSLSWILWILLLLLSFACPIALLVGSIRETGALCEALQLHADDWMGSLGIAGVTAVMTLAIGIGVMRMKERSGFRRPAAVIETTIYLAMLLPGALVASGLLSLVSAGSWGDGLRQSVWIVALGQTGRYTGVTLILLSLLRNARLEELLEMAEVDGAGRFQRWRRVSWPHTAPVAAGTVLVVMMLSMTELGATMILLPAGVPNFAQRLLNQMHYAREQQVIASCVILVSIFVVLGLTVSHWFRRAAIRRSTSFALFLALLTLAGCWQTRPTGEPKVLGSFGRTGRGNGDFVYPRGIDFDGQQLFIVDKTGRIQRFSPDGRWLGLSQMPMIEMGKPVGISAAPDGRLYVADTHYYRVAVFSAEGQMVSSFGEFGEGDGQFIYPTDIAFAPDGRIFVSEYGGHDRISIFDRDHKFLGSFGSPGGDPGQFSRPQAMAIDPAKRILYVADACNHRIEVYDLDGKFLRTIGQIGRKPGQMRYPYGLALCANGDLVVCEYGNNRIQVFNAAGESIAVFGGAGRQLGQLAYPWGVTVDDHRRAFVVDAGNDRIQIWQL